MKPKIILLATHKLYFNGTFGIKGGVERLLFNLIDILNKEYECIVYQWDYIDNIMDIYELNTTTRTFIQHVKVEKSEIWQTINQHNPAHVIIVDDSVKKHLPKNIIIEIQKKYNNIYYAQSWQGDPRIERHNKVICNYQIKNAYSVESKILQIGGTYNDKIFYNKNLKRQNSAIYTGRFDNDKNLIELVECWEFIYKNHGTILKLVGGHNNLKNFEKIKAYIKEDSGIETIDWVNDEYLCELYNTSKLFINPSKEESFCCSLVEAMACGAICIVNGKYNAFKETELNQYVIGNSEKYTNDLKNFIIRGILYEKNSDAQELWIKNHYSTSHLSNEILNFINR